MRSVKCMGGQLIVALDQGHLRMYAPGFKGELFSAQDTRAIRALVLPAGEEIELAYERELAGYSQTVNAVNAQRRVESHRSQEYYQEGVEGVEL